jgi:hypothetical protein
MVNDIRGPGVRLWGQGLRHEGRTFRAFGHEKILPELIGKARCSLKSFDHLKVSGPRPCTPMFCRRLSQSLPCTDCPTRIRSLLLLDVRLTPSVGLRPADRDLVG